MKNTVIFAPETKEHDVMAYVKILKENELFGGTDNTDVYPVSSTQAIMSQSSDGGRPEGVPMKLEDRLKRHEDDTAEIKEFNGVVRQAIYWEELK